MILWGSYNCSYGPTLDALLAESTTEGERSEVYMYQTMIRQSGGVVGPIIAILLFFYMGNTWEIDICRKVMLMGLVVMTFATSALLRVKSVAPPSSDSGNGTCDGTATYEMVSLRDHGDDVDHADTGAKIDAAENGNAEGRQSVRNVTGDEKGNAEDTATSLTKSLSAAQLRNEEMASIKCSCCNVSYVAAMIVCSDMMTGLASGMTIKFFPIFFMNEINMQPVELALLYMCCPLASAGTLWVNQNYTRKLFGRLWTPIILKAVGVSCLLVICYLALRHPDRALTIQILFVVRTGLMNSTKPLTKSVINDIVPPGERGRWNALESVNAATWSGSAAIGGVLVDSYGYVPNFFATACMQLISSIPLMMVASLVCEEGMGETRKVVVAESTEKEDDTVEERERSSLLAEGNA